jgi:hypothetical protein
MEGMGETVLLPLTREEAFELLDRCLQSQCDDNEALRSALVKITEAVRARETFRAA